jgi:hypothetical protein
MRRRPAIHTSKRGWKWVNTREGSGRAIGGWYDSHVEAVAAGRRLAREELAEHVIHRADGSIDEIIVVG